MLKRRAFSNKNQQSYFFGEPMVMLTPRQGCLDTE
jgi:hypothetical protein